jgi:peroxiredoxin Q/BCP
VNERGEPRVAPLDGVFIRASRRAFARRRLDPGGYARRTARPSKEERTMVEEGKQAPDFELTSDSGESVRLSDLRGKQVVLYFYPKDDTPGCTAQACGIRDVYGEFEREGAIVLGVSPDNERSHVKFKEKFDLPFTLLADEGHRVADEYGVWAEKKYLGKTYWGVARSTFVIDEDGNVKRVMHKVKPDTHADEVLETLRS